MKRCVLSIYCRPFSIILNECLKLKHLEEHYRCVNGDETLVTSSEALRLKIGEVFQPIRSILEYQGSYVWISTWDNLYQTYTFILNPNMKDCAIPWIRCGEHWYPFGMVLLLSTIPYITRSTHSIFGEFGSGMNVSRWVSKYFNTCTEWLTNS